MQYEVSLLIIIVYDLSPPKGKYYRKSRSANLSLKKLATIAYSVEI